MDLNATLIGQTIAMIVFVWFCMKFVWPPLLGMIEERPDETLQLRCGRRVWFGGTGQHGERKRQGEDQARAGFMHG